MKKYSHQIIISLLVVTLGFSMYLLYSKKDLTSTNTTQILQDDKTVDVLELKKQKQNRLTRTSPQTIDTKKVSQNLLELKAMLAQTKDMLKKYNSNNANVIITNNKIDKLVNLDFKHSNKIDSLQNDEINEKQEDISLDEPSLENTKIDVENINNNQNNYAATSSSSVSSSSSTTTSTTSTTQNQTTNTQTTDNQTQTLSEDVTTQVAKLRTQIDDVKKIISKVSSDIN